MREWELDPLFAAAEVVQDSADRMDSVFRLLFHEQSLASGDQMDKQLLSSIEYHKRDLATALETAKWQLEDFEREVKFSARADKSMLKQNVIRRHMQFIGAIRGQITQLEQNMNSSAENLLRNVNLNEEDRDGFALFLLGKEPIKHMVDEEPEDNAILGRRLGPDMSSSSKEDFDKKKAGQIASLIADEIQYLDRNLELKIFQTVMDLGPSVSFEEANINNGGYGEEGNWDLEANHANGRSYLQKNNLRGYFGRTNIFESLGTFLSTHKRRFSRSLTKRFKDGEELTQYPSFDNIHRGMQQFRIAGLGIVEKNSRDLYIGFKPDIIQYHLYWRCF
ncbi:hypothetical protein OROHE_019104 [Orobanche hederae]